MQNIYKSNAIGMNKRAHIPKPIDFSYQGKDKLNNFHASPTSYRRYVSETYKAGDRNHKIPTTSSPVMMTSGVSPAQFNSEQKKTHTLVNTFLSRANYKLPEQGPAVLPLSGKGGSPIRLARRKNSAPDDF